MRKILNIQHRNIDYFAEEWCTESEMGLHLRVAFRNPFDPVWSDLPGYMSIITNSTGNEAVVKELLIGQIL